MRLEAAMYLNSKQFVIIFHLSFAIFAASALLSGERTGLVSTLILIAIITATNQLSGPSIVALLPDKSEITAEILANCCSPGAIVIFSPIHEMGLGYTAGWSSPNLPPPARSTMPPRAACLLWALTLALGLGQTGE